MKHLTTQPNTGRVVNPGHLYELAYFENREGGQLIQFIEKEPTTIDGKPAFKTVSDGTTNEEVIKMLIHRLECMYAKFPSEETMCAISHLKQALYALQSRTYDRMQRNVEGKPLA